MNSTLQSRFTRNKKIIFLLSVTRNEEVVLSTALDSFFILFSVTTPLATLSSNKFKCPRNLLPLTQSRSLVYGPRKVRNFLHFDDENFSKSTHLKIFLRWEKLSTENGMQSFYTQTFVYKKHKTNIKSISFCSFYCERYKLI